MLAAFVEAMAEQREAKGVGLELRGSRLRRAHFAAQWTAMVDTGQQRRGFLLVVSGIRSG